MVLVIIALIIIAFLLSIMPYWLLIYDNIKSRFILRSEKIKKSNPPHNYQNPVFIKETCEHTKLQYNNTGVTFKVNSPNRINVLSDQQKIYLVNIHNELDD